MEEDLEDGELWLPPDFFSMEEAQSSTNFHHSDTNPFCMDDFDLINRSASFAFLSPYTPALYKPLQLNPARLYNPTAVHNFCCCCRTGTGTVRNQPVYLNPVDAFMGERAWALHIQHQNRFALNRVRPGGTGVFLPRIEGTATVGINRIEQGVNYKHEINVPPRKRMLNRRRPND